jgi:hypothetical protein
MKYLVRAVGVAIVVVLAIFAVNYARLQAPVRPAIAEGIEVWTHYRYGVRPDVIVFDLRTIAPENAPAQVYGSLFRAAERLKDRSFSSVILAHRGTAKFVLDGASFREIGRTNDFQNPIFTIRTLPEKLSTPDGKPAFPSWSGGLLGVLSKQMEDVNRLSERWFISDLAGS